MPNYGKLRILISRHRSLIYPGKTINVGIDPDLLLAATRPVQMKIFYSPYNGIAK